MKRKSADGIVFSTNPDFKFENETDQEKATLHPGQQQLRIWIDAKGRRGKTVTIVKGFEGSNKDLNILAKELKMICGSGGTVKDGLIVIQGNVREKILDFLVEKGYRVKKAGG